VPGGDKVSQITTFAPFELDPAEATTDPLADT